MRHSLAPLVAALAGVVVLAGCGRPPVVTRPVAPPPASALHDEYAESLRETATDRTPLGSEWFRAAELAIQAPADISLPFRETGFFSAKEALAAGYRFTLGRGQRAVIDVQGAQAGAPPLFLDLFEVSRGDLRRAQPVYADVERVSIIPARDAEYVLRVQPRLGAERRYTLTLRTGADLTSRTGTGSTAPVAGTGTSLTFPIAGIDTSRIGSFFGASRDNGQRTHDGVDIFAPRGTLVVAAADGVVSRTSSGGLGGNGVWLHDPVADLDYYYAHLDRWTVRVGERVSAGQTIGFVGNTGNAASGPPHLHFSVYKPGGQAVDPMPFLRRTVAPVPPVAADGPPLGRRLRTGPATARLSTAPDDRGEEVSELPAHTVLWVDAATERAYRVRLPDGTAGYVLAMATEGVAEPIRTLTLTAPTDLLDRPLPSGVAVARADRGAMLSVLGVFQGYLFVRTRDGQEGWVKGT